MGRMKKKHEAGAATNYLSRNQALKKLQLNLKDFKRLCILKGIYPHEPLHKKKVNKGSTENKIFYYVKDINFLASEPIINKFRDYKIHLRRVIKAKAKKEREKVEKLFDNRPQYTLDKIVKERYPSLIAAIRDLDDGLCLCFMFATLPNSRVVKANLVHDCRRLTVEFMHYVIVAKALRKAFVSVKGIYYQAEIMGEKVTWVVPHERGLPSVSDVDFSVMATFIEFYTTALGFVNFSLFKSVGLHYPPKLKYEEHKSARGDGEENTERIYSLTQDLERVAQQPEECQDPDHFSLGEEGSSVDSEAIREQWESLKRLRDLFKNCRFFLNREVPKQALAFIIRCCGGTASWQSGPGATYSEDDSRITHQIVDRPKVDKKNIDRTYVQPQWIFDSFNARRQLPVDRYFPGAILPPHLSPFVDDKPGDYIPQERLDRLVEEGRDVNHLIAKKSDAIVSKKQKPNSGEQKKSGKKESKSVEMSVKSGNVHRENKQILMNEEGQRLKMQEMMIAKRYKRVYNKIKRGKKRHQAEVRTLHEKRRNIEAS